MDWTYPIRKYTGKPYKRYPKKYIRVNGKKTRKFFRIEKWRKGIKEKELDSHKRDIALNKVHEILKNDIDKCVAKHKGIVITEPSEKTSVDKASGIIMVEPVTKELTTDLSQMKIRAQTASKLTREQKLFARAYIDPASETYGDVEASFTKIFGLQKKALEKGYLLITYPSVRKYLGQIIAASGWNDDIVDAEHLRIIKQGENLPSKMQAIKEYNRLNNRVNDNPQVQVTFGHFAQQINKYCSDDSQGNSEQP